MARSRAEMKAWPLVFCVTVLGGCTTPLGTAPLVARDSNLVGTKLLRPGATGRSCRTTILGIVVGDEAGTLDEALARVLSQDAEGNLVTDAVVHEERMTTGVVNRRCVVVRGDLARSVTTLTLPSPHQHGKH